ncbi:MAG: outer membrane lipoprotein carrier protein LolA [Bdellovibrionales bacterium]|nr:outer membrane lipoprotein carrier protein LolA [Bdellovibrionales bacterium]
MRFIVLILSLISAASCMSAPETKPVQDEMWDEIESTSPSERVDLNAGEGSAKILPGISDKKKEPEKEIEEPSRGSKKAAKPSKGIKNKHHQVGEKKRESKILKASKKSAQVAPEIDEIKAVVGKYKESQAVGMKVEKKIHLALLDETKTGRGRLWFSRGRLKVQIDKPEGSLLVVDNHTVWLESSLTDDPSGFVQVTKMKASQIRKSNALLAILFGDEAVWSKFELVTSHRQDGDLHMELKPQSGAKLLDVTKIRIVLRKSLSEIAEITYWDELENETSYKFSDVDFDISLSAKDFKYTPPPDAEISEF